MMVKSAMPKVERRYRDVVSRLLSEGWVSAGGTRHEKFKHPDRPAQRIMVPRHNELSVGVALQIAKDPGWI